MVVDVLVIGAGPAGLAISAALCNAGVRVQGLSLSQPSFPWKNTYGIWRDDLERLELTNLLGKSWKDCTVYADEGEIALNREYGLFDNARFQNFLLEQCDRGGMTWQVGSAARVEEDGLFAHLTTKDGQEILSRVVIDASGHEPVLLKRPPLKRIAFQTAYGVVGTFSTPPVRSGQMVLMDYRTDHLPIRAPKDPPTFLYAMDLGEGLYFVEETSLANHPAVSLDLLETRLTQRLEYRGIRVLEVQDIERCIFPMNLPIPYLKQEVFGYGGAASMVHPASGYQVGAALRRAPEIAMRITQCLDSGMTPSGIANLAWDTLWPSERIRNRNLYLFGLENIMRLDSYKINRFFRSFFTLPDAFWNGYLSDRLNHPELLQTMTRLFLKAPWDVKISLISSIGSQWMLFREAVFG